MLLLIAHFLPVKAALAPNLALNKPVISSDAVWTGFTPAALTDGDPNTICHPLANSGTLGYYFEVDLGATYQLDHILLRNRADGCCPERLSNYRVEIYADGGDETGPLNWSAVIRADGSNSGASGVDIISTTNNPAGDFAGRYIRVVNNNGAAYSPQLAEIEVYGGVPPDIRLFAADDDTIASGNAATLRWDISGAKSVSISPEAGLVAMTNGFVFVHPATSTTYILEAINDGGTSRATVNVGVDVILQPPRITEFLAQNETGIKDNDGDASDWIELANPNLYSLDLQGYYLTDSAANLRQWPFPSVKIAPNGFMVVFASGKDLRLPNGELHTNFKLDNKGEYLALVDQNGSVIQQFPQNYPIQAKFPPQSKDISYGWGTNDLIGFMRPPTPGKENGFAYAGIVEDVQFNIGRGFYETNLDIILSTGTADAVIRYTLDDSEPTDTQGTIYSAPIHVTKTTVIRAATFKPAWAPTPVKTHTYVFPGNVIASSVMRTNITLNPAYSSQIRSGLLDIPSVSLTTKATINDDAEVKTSIEWLNPDGSPGFQEDCGVRYYGGAFTTFEKKSFRLYFRSTYGASKLKYPIFTGFDHGLAPVEEFDQLELRSGSHDMTLRGFYMENIFTDDTFLDMGQLNPHGRFVHLYLNGTYWGMFHLRERWNAAMHQSYLGGARTNYESINGNWNVGGWADPGTPYDGDGSVWTHLKEVRGNYRQAREWLDAPQYVDYMLMWMFGGAEDEYRCVGPNVPGSGFKFYLNDADGWFCGSWYCAAGGRTSRGAPGRSPGDGPG